MTLLNLPMRDALRLVRSGKLSEATKLIKAALSGKPDVAEGPIDVEYEVVDPVADVHRREAAAVPLTVVDTIAGDDRPQVRSAPFHARRATPAPRDLDGEGTFKEGTYANAAGLRNYKLWVPAGAAELRIPLPLIVMLHGCTQDADDFAAGTRMNVRSAREQCYVLYPNQSAAANFNRCWQWFRPEDQHREAGEPSILADLTASIVKDHAIDPGRVYVAGLSAGAAMAVILGRLYPDLFAAVASHSGLPYGVADSVPSALAAMSGQVRPARRGAKPVTDVPALPCRGIAIHGDRDTTVAPSNSDALVAQWRQAYANGGRTKLIDEAVDEQGARVARVRDGNGRVLIENWIIAGGGHAWSGGDPRGTYASPVGPDASQLILDFFFNESDASIQ